MSVNAVGRSGPRTGWRWIIVRADFMKSEAAPTRTGLVLRRLRADRSGVN